MKNNKKVKSESVAAKTIAEIIGCFSLNNEELGINEIARKLNYYPSKVHRILATMERYGFLDKIPTTKKYRIGLRFLQVGLLYPLNHPVIRITRPHAMEIAKNFTTNVSIGMLSKTKPYCAVIIDSFVNFDPTILLNRVTNNVSLHCSSLGKALLSFSEKEFADSIIQSIELKKFTASTITDRNELKKEIRNTRKRGYALDEGEVKPDQFCIGVPIRDSNGLVAAISISDRSGKVKKMKDVFIEKLLTTSEIVSYQLGYTKSF
jgi:DNA-binding IclR family transcriptional regulator